MGDDRALGSLAIELDQFDLVDAEVVTCVQTCSTVSDETSRREA